MESQSHLGIYLRKNEATIVCLALGKEGRLLDCFSVSVEDQPEPDRQLLADRIAQACRGRKVRFAEAAVALDCASFMQHAVHSEFRDARKIVATVRFDTEEALATDVSDVAVGFRVASSTDEGSSLDVFTAQRGILSDIILSLQSNGIDPVSVDPDICCLSRYLLAYAGTEESSDGGILYALLSDRRGYLIVISEGREVSALRTFLIGPAQDRTALLVREALVMTALAEAAGSVGRLCVFDAGRDVDTQSLRERTGLGVGTCDLVAMAGLELREGDGCPDAVDVALACGAAMALSEPANSVNLRNDHMPYLGRKRRIEKAVRFLSISLTILLLAVGVYVHAELIRKNREREALRRKLEPDYRAVMLGEKKLPTPMKKAVDNLERALRQLRAEKTGIGASQASISTKLTMVLQSLNNCAARTDLNIDSITASGTSIIISGDTSSRQNTVLVHEALKQNGLWIRQQSADPQGTRDSFTVTVTIERQSQGA